MCLLCRHYRGLWRTLPIIEGLVFFASVYVAAYTRLDPWRVPQDIGVVWVEAALFSGIVLLALAVVGLYAPRLRDGAEGILVRIALGFVGATLALALIYYVVRGAFLGRGILVIALCLSLALVVVLRMYLLWLARQEDGKQRVLVLGAGRWAHALVRMRRRTDLVGIRLVGFVQVEGDDISIPEDRLIELDRSLPDWVKANDIDEVVVAPDERRNRIDMQQLLQCRQAGVSVSDLARFYERETGRLRVDDMLQSWLAFSGVSGSGRLRDRIQRLLDMAVALVLSVFAAPIAALAALAIWIESGLRGPILYRQLRVGLNGREFYVFKFRSMQTDAEKSGGAQWAAAGDARITRVGAILRRYRIDEIPQIWNVLRGEMSFVGPRPERPEFVQRLMTEIPAYVERHQVKPGLTGWAQIFYPYGASDHDAFEKLEYDLYYVKNRNLYLDLIILLQTAEVVVWGHGVR